MVVISAHWETVGTYVSVNRRPRTIHDFGGFPEELYRVSYAPQGHPASAREIKQLVTITDVVEDSETGLDHGAWTVLKFIWPAADVPVFGFAALPIYPATSSIVCLVVLLFAILYFFAIFST